MTESGPEEQAARERRRKLAEVFGDVLPDTTSDERAPGTSGNAETDRWYRENRPPHYENG